MIYKDGNKWIYEHDGEIIAVEYSYEMVKACGDARVKAMQPNNASSRTADGLCKHYILNDRGKCVECGVQIRRR